jgi:hypothetical protein
MIKELAVKTKNYKIQIFGLGYRGGITLSLHGAVDIDRINDEVISLCEAAPNSLNFERDTFYDKNKVRITYEEVA